MDEQALRKLQAEYAETLTRLRGRRMEVQAGLHKSKQRTLDLKRIGYLLNEEAEINVLLADIERSLAGTTRFK